MKKLHTRVFSQAEPVILDIQYVLESCPPTARSDLKDFKFVMPLISLKHFLYSSTTPPTPLIVCIFVLSTVEFDHESASNSFVFHLDIVKREKRLDAESATSL